MTRTMLILVVLAAAASPAPTAFSQPALPLEIVTERWTGDLDGIIARRRLRVLTLYNRTHYFVDRGVQRGLVYEAGVKLEAELNRRLNTSAASRVHVVFVPARRDELLPWLIEGRGDLIASGVPVTPERARLVDLTVPTQRALNQIVVTGRGVPPLTTLGDLAGRELAVRVESRELERVTTINVDLKRRGRPPITIRALSATLDDEDLLEMVHAGFVQGAVVDEYTARFWREVLPGLVLHPALAVEANMPVAWAARKGSPQLLAMLDPIIVSNRVGTAFGNTLLARHLRRAKLLRRATTPSDLARFRSLTTLFKKYSERYGLDPLLMMAQGYQESGLKQAARSRAGAVGIMQVMPATAREMNTGDVGLLEPNIHAGIKYMRWIADRAVGGERLDPLNRTLFALAAYNCGIGVLRELRAETARRGLNPNEWFNHLERVTEERVGRETVQYVSNVYKYYIAYQLAQERGVSSRPPVDHLR